MHALLRARRHPHNKLPTSLNRPLSTSNVTDFRTILGGPGFQYPFQTSCQEALRRQSLVASVLFFGPVKCRWIRGSLACRNGRIQGFQRRRDGLQDRVGELFSVRVRARAPGLPGLPNGRMITTNRWTRRYRTALVSTTGGRTAAIATRGGRTGGTPQDPAQQDQEDAPVRSSARCWSLGLGHAVLSTTRCESSWPTASGDRWKGR